MATPKFYSADPGLDHIYDEANSLSIGSKFNYVGNILTVTGFTKRHIKTVDESGNKSKMDAANFSMYILYGFIKQS